MTASWGKRTAPTPVYSSRYATCMDPDCEERYHGRPAPASRYRIEGVAFGKAFVSHGWYCNQHKPAGAKREKR